MKHFVCNGFPISQWWGTLQTSPYQLHTQGRMGTMPSHEIGFILNYSYEILNLYNPSNHVFLKKTEILQQNDDISICFWRHSTAKKQRFCNRMMTFVYVFGGILCGLHKVHKTPRIPSILKIWGSNV